MTDTNKPSAFTRWAARFGWLCLLLVPLSVASVHFGLLPFEIGLSVFALACLLALVILLVLVIALLIPRLGTQRKVNLKAMLPAVVPALLLVVLMGSAGDAPVIHDVTTDTEEPPEFVMGIAQRGEESNTLAIKPDYIEQQKVHYPELKTLKSSLSVSEAFALASSVATELDWEIYNSDPDAGLIEASSTSFWFRFVDDIVIRIRPDGEGSAIDLRSVSRVGKGDMGVNAKRINAFLSAFQC
ncbi:MAG: DUF1499 domain-containing protein [Gammaproteobacteria bacterium]